MVIRHFPNHCQCYYPKRLVNSVRQKMTLDPLATIAVEMRKMFQGKFKRYGRVMRFEISTVAGPFRIAANIFLRFAHLYLRKFLKSPTFSFVLCHVPSRCSAVIYPTLWIITSWPECPRPASPVWPLPASDRPRSPLFRWRTLCRSHIQTICTVPTVSRLLDRG